MSSRLPDPAILPTISVRRAAMILGIGRSTLYAIVARDECPVIRIGSHTVRIPTAKFLAHFELVPGVAADAEQE